MNRHIVLSFVVLAFISFQSKPCQAIDLWPFNNGVEKTSKGTSWWNKSIIKPTEISSTPKPAGPSMFTKVSEEFGKVADGTKKTITTVGSKLNPVQYMPKNMKPSIPKYLKPSYYYSPKKSSAAPTGYGKTTKSKSSSPWWRAGSTEDKKPVGMSSWVNGARP